MEIHRIIATFSMKVLLSWISNYNENKIPLIAHKFVEKISSKNVRCWQFSCQMYTDVLFQFEFVEIENTKSINDVNYGIYWENSIDQVHY